MEPGQPVIYEKNAAFRFEKRRFDYLEHMGFEPTTSYMRSKRSPN